ncbi:GMC oxidoreductase [Sphaerobolus stellatus SS14]|uniref:GMC oxidoreductase n=1 Tax=Sphaerobolus stellatus (strain SS14) TaxID=990650 RepID=A0A0C9UH07_SPHS4|nr:GMC oxidoreductase [Sphaerobolus stellatus SS14]
MWQNCVTQLMQKNRCDAASAFLPPSLVQTHKANLHICVDTLVMHLSMIATADGAKAIDWIHIESMSKASDIKVEIQANSEVILCAGALGTPQILMLISAESVLQTILPN